MASGERRLGTSRRGMTVLGKIPMPSVPKPINLPSQRSENRGLDSNVEIVPRGTFSWGNAAGVSNAGVPCVTSSSATSSGPLNSGIKSSTSGINVGSPLENPSSSGTGTRPLCAPTIATTTAWGSSAKTQVPVQVPSGGFLVVSMESVAPGAKENLPQHNEILFNRPAARDGTVRNIELHPHPGTGRYHVRCYEGLQNPGDDPTSAAGIELPGMTPYSRPLPHEVGLQSIGAPHYSSPHNMDMTLARMVTKSSLYENYRPHLTLEACSGQSGVHTRNVEQFANYGNHVAAGTSDNTDSRTGLSTDCNNFERGGLFDPGQDFHMYSDGQLGAVPRDQGYSYRDADTYDMVSYSTQKNERDHAIPRPFRSCKHVNEAVDFPKHEVASFAKQVPERKIILLTKAPRIEAQRSENSINSSPSLPECDKGSDSCEQELGRSKLEVKHESSDISILSKVQGGKDAKEIFESKEVDGCEKGSPTETTNFKIANQDGICITEDLPEFKTGIKKMWSAGLPSSTLPSTTSNGNTKNAGSNFSSKHDGKADAESRRGKPARQPRKFMIQGGWEPVADDHQPVCSVRMKQIITEDVTRRYDQKLQTKALNHKTEKAWRPKSPALDSVLTPVGSSSQTAGRERVNETNCGKSTDRGESSQECSPGDVVGLETSTSLQKRRTRKLRNMSNLVSADTSSKVADPSLSVALNIQQPEIAGCAVDQLSGYKHGRAILKDTYSSDACSPTFSVTLGLNAEDFNYVEIDKLYQRKANGRPSNHKAEKEWHPLSPTVEAAASTSSDFHSRSSEANIILLPILDNNPMKGNHDSKFMEQEGPQVLDAYDYERQRAKLKEIAAQRAKQRGKEEEERAREQMAKARAKLEELEKRTKSISASIEVNEHSAVVLTDEAPKQKTKKRLSPSRGSSTVISAHDLENQQQIDEVSIQDFLKRTAPVPHIVDEEVANNEELVSYPLRNKGEGFEKSSLNIVEDLEVRDSVSGTSSGQGQRRVLREDLWLPQNGLVSVHDMETNFCSDEKYGVKKVEAANSVRPQRHKRESRNQVRAVASNHGIKKKGIARAIDEREELKLLPAVQSQFTGRGRSLQSNAEEIRKLKVAELLASKDEPLALSASEKNSRLRLSDTHMHQSAPEGLQKRGGKLEVSDTVEQVRSSETQQLVKPITGSSVDILSEKVGQLHVSGRQRDPHGYQFQLDSDRTNGNVKTDRLSALEVTLNAPALSRKSWKKKQSCHGQQGVVEFEGYVMDERNTNMAGHMDFESVELTAPFNLSNEAQVNSVEHIKHGASCKSLRRGKNGKIGGRTSKSNVKNSGVTDEAFQEISDHIVPYTLAISQSSYPHKSRNNVKRSPKAAFEMSQQNISHSVKATSDSASSCEQQAGSHTAFEEDSVVYPPCHWVRSSSQCGNYEQEAKTVSVNRPRKRGSRSQAVAKLPVVTTHYEHQDMHSMGLPEVVADLSIKNRMNYETRRTTKQHQASLDAFSPHNRHHEAEIEYHEEERPFNRGNGARRSSSRIHSQRQLNGCLAAADLDRSDAETGKTSGIKQWSDWLFHWSLCRLKASVFAQNSAQPYVRCRAGMKHSLRNAELEDLRYVHKVSP
ncbi:hypothetical protein L7F22_038521 [Adiantum nelumboides]|nr:hypothetical protein [Adiantum nelumboides]